MHKTRRTNLEAETKGRRRCWRRPGWSLSAFVCFCSSPLFSVGVRLLSFISLTSSFSISTDFSVSLLPVLFYLFFWYSSVPPPRLCVFLFFTLYPFSFASRPLCFFFSSSPGFFFSSPVLSLFLSLFLLSVISVFSFSPLPLVRGLSWTLN